MSTLQAPPPMEAKASQSFVKLPGFTESDSHVLTIVAMNYIESHPFDRKDEKTGKEFVKDAPAVEFYMGTLVNGEPRFLKTWPMIYSWSKKANLKKWYEASTGTTIQEGKVYSAMDMIGKSLLGEVECSNKVSSKGTAYVANKLKGASKVPSVLVQQITPLATLKPALDAILAKGKDQAPAEDNNVPF